MTTYIIKVGAEYAERLAAIIRTYGHLKVGKDFVDLGGGRVRLTDAAVETFRDHCGPDDDGYIDGRNLLWIGGDGHPLRPEGDEAAAEEISSAEEWADAIDKEMKRTGQDPGTLISLGYANGQICGIVLDPQHPDADDERAVIASTSGWVVGYDPQSRYWTAR